MAGRRVHRGDDLEVDAVGPDGAVLERARDLVVAAGEGQFDGGGHSHLHILRGHRPRKRAIQYSVTSRWECSARSQATVVTGLPACAGNDETGFGDMKTTSAATMVAAAKT